MFFCTVSLLTDMQWTYGEHAFIVEIWCSNGRLIIETMRAFKKIIINALAGCFPNRKLFVKRAVKFMEICSVKNK